MLSHENNKILTEVGPGTIMGDLMRQYWVPALLSSELPGPDADPVRVRLLGEDLVAFRDSDGRVGLLEESCPHRGASLYFGRSEKNGLRCVYHGWKFGVTGACLDMPNEPPGSDFASKVRANAYPCVEAGNIVWTYMGTRETPPPLPHFEQFDTPPDQQSTWALLRDCNWLQAIEGDLDTSHFGFLHAGHATPDDAPPESFLRYTIADRAPRYTLCDTDFGVTYGAYRPADTPAEYYWRIGHFLFPFYTMVPTGVLGIPGPVRAWVPMDDTHTMFFQVGYRSELAPADQSVGLTEREYRTVQIVPRTSDAYGRFRLRQNLANDYFMDRDKKRLGESFTGIDGVTVEDQAITESMGPVYDRTKEHLGSADVMVIRSRRRLLAAARALRESGAVPPGVECPESYAQRSGGVILPAGADWLEATEHLRRAGVEHPDLDRARAGGA
jgi:phenylpropionate dioxygenase-like ring-hydroxylating dioxygenase large terminal subunit